MRRQTIIDVVPITRNGQIVYTETTLGSLGVSQSFVNTTTNITNVTNAAAAAVPNKPVSYQSDFSKVANVVATGASVVAAATVWFPPAAIIAGVVAAAAALLGKVFANSKAKKYAAERGEYETANAQIRYENEQLDNQYILANNAINELRQRVKALSGFTTEGASLSGLGSKASKEKAKLQSAKAENELLVKEQETKTKLMASLLDEYNKLMKNLLTFNQVKSTNEWIIWILAGAAVFLGGYYVVQDKKHLK